MSQDCDMVDEDATQSCYLTYAHIWLISGRTELIMMIILHFDWLIYLWHKIKTQKNDIICILTHLVTGDVGSTVHINIPVLHPTASTDADKGLDIQQNRPLLSNR